MRFLLFLLIPVIGFSQKDVVWVSGVVKDKQVKFILPDSHVRINDTTLITDETGAFKYKWDTTIFKELHFKVESFLTEKNFKGKSKYKYYPTFDTLRIKDVNYKAMIFDLELEKIITGCSWNFVSPYFGFNETELKSSGKLYLNSLVEILQQMPNLAIQINGQTCELESEKESGKTRAEKAKNYLISKEIKANRIETAAVIHTYEYYFWQYAKSIANIGSEILFTDSISMMKSWKNSSMAFQIEFAVKHTNYPNEKLQGIDTIINRNVTVPKFVCGVLIDKITKLPVSDATVSITGSDGSNREIHTSNGFYYFLVNENTTYQIQGDSDLGYTVCGISRRKYFASEKALISTIQAYSNDQTIFFQPITFEEIGGCGFITFPTFKSNEGQLIEEMKLRLNGVVELLNMNPSLTVFIRHVKRPDLVELMIKYLVSKGISSDRLESKELDVFRLGCQFIGTHIKEYEDLEDNLILTKENIERFSPKTQELLLPMIGTNIGFQVKSTDYKP